jgi:hypothetical protein
MSSPVVDITLKSSAIVMVLADSKLNMFRIENCIILRYAISLACSPEAFWNDVNSSRFRTVVYFVPIRLTLGTF